MVSLVGWVKVGITTEGTKMDQRRHAPHWWVSSSWSGGCTTLVSASVPSCSAPSLCHIHPLPPQLFLSVLGGRVTTAHC